MEKIQPGKFIELAFDIYQLLPDGKEQLQASVSEQEPEVLIMGVTQGILPAMERGLTGLEAGQTFDIKVPAAEGFPFNPDDVVDLEKKIFEVDGKFDSEMVHAGAYVPMATAEGFRITGKVLEVTDKMVKVDFNHPFTGMDLRLTGKVLTVRDATPEDLHPQGGCSCGCHGDCSGDECHAGECGCN